MTSKGKSAVIILNWNGKLDTLACLKSVAAIDYPDWMTIVVDNGSTDGSIEAIRSQFPSVILIENKENLGFAEGNNVGIRFALQTDVEWILLLNNDTLVDPQILNAFASGFAQYPKAGILGAKIYLFDQRDTLDHWGGMWNPKKAHFDLIGLRQKEEAADDETPQSRLQNSSTQQNRPFEALCAPASSPTLSGMVSSAGDGQLSLSSQSTSKSSIFLGTGVLQPAPQTIDYVCGAALAARRNVWETVGLLEPKFFLIWEESDFCFHAKKKGLHHDDLPQSLHLPQSLRFICGQTPLHLFLVAQPPPLDREKLFS